MGDWMDGFSITHYTYALEADPLYHKDELVTAEGLEEKHRKGFLFGARGVLMQGTGLTLDGKYITVDWFNKNSRGRKGPDGVHTRFIYGVGGKKGAPSAWKTIAVDPKIIKLGSSVRIEKYPNKTFTASDTGENITGKRIDVFIGAVSIEEADKYGKITSRVMIVD